MGLEGLYDWFLEQGKILLFITLICLIIWAVVKRAWIAMVGIIIGAAFVGIFILNPEIITNISEFMSDKLNLAN